MAITVRYIDDEQVHYDTANHWALMSTRTGPHLISSGDIALYDEDKPVAVIGAGTFKSIQLTGSA